MDRYSCRAFRIAKPRDEEDVGRVWTLPSKSFSPPSRIECAGRCARRPREEKRLGTQRKVLEEATICVVPLTTPGAYLAMSPRRDDFTTRKTGDSDETETECRHRLDKKKINGSGGTRFTFLFGNVPLLLSMEDAKQNKASI